MVSRLWEGICQSPQKVLATDPDCSPLGKAASPTFSEGKVVMTPFKFFVEQVESYEREVLKGFRMRFYLHGHGTKITPGVPMKTYTVQKDLLWF